MSSNINIREAKREDLPKIVMLLANDPLGSQRECSQDPLPDQYYSAFDEINADKNNHLMVAEIDNNIVGTLQLTILQYVTYQGGKRGQIEGVRVDESYRGQGIGKKMVEFAINLSRDTGCHLVQLTMDKERMDTIKFYNSIGFIDSHEGLKYHI